MQTSEELDIYLLNKKTKMNHICCNFFQNSSIRIIVHSGSDTQLCSICSPIRKYCIMVVTVHSAGHTLDSGFGQRRATLRICIREERFNWVLQSTSPRRKMVLQLYCFAMNNCGSRTSDHLWTHERKKWERISGVHMSINTFSQVTLMFTMGIPLGCDRLFFWW